MNDSKSCPLNSKQNKKNNPSNSVKSFMLDCFNVKKLYLQDKSIKQTLRNPDLVHKIIIDNTEHNVEKDLILQAVFKQSEPNVLVPMFLTEEGKKIEFYCMHCGSVLNKFCNEKLSLHVIKNNKKITLPMTLIVATEKPNNIYAPDKIFHFLIQSRISKSSPVEINLSTFNRISGIQSTIYLNINFPQCFNYIMKSLKMFSPNSINLSCNDLESLEGWKIAYSLVSIDLSFNQIKSIHDLGPLKNVGESLKKINLYENPIWNTFPSTSECISKLNRIFPKADIINQFGHTLQSEDNIVLSEGAIYLVDQFMEHYYSLYEHPNRRKRLHEIYHKNAIFSINSDTIDEFGKLSFITQNSENDPLYFHKHKTKKVLAIGPDEITRKILYLPEVEHDHSTFEIDILHYVENKSTAFSITGILREISANPLFYSFTRTFVLQAGRKGEYHIMNDMFNVSNCQHRISRHVQVFKETSIFKSLDISEYLPLPTPVSIKEKNQMIATFCEITMLHGQHARNLLEKHHWKFKEALETFIHDFRFDQIPFDFFLE